MGGIKLSLSRLLASDPNCGNSRILAAALGMFSMPRPSALVYAQVLETLGDTITSSNRYIKLHTQALIDWSLGYRSRATDTWETILLSYPFDIMTLRFSVDTYVHLGNQTMLRDSVARVLPIWESSSPHRPLKSYLHGMYAFGLDETNMVIQAEKQARLGLELNEHDGWATHALTHSIAYMGRTSEGIDFLEKTENHWHQCDIIASHLDWHWAVYELEQNNWEKAEEILEHCFLNNDGTELSRLKYTDAASLIYRLKLTGHSCPSKLNSRFKQFLDSHLRDHQTLFHDFHHYFVLDNFGDIEKKKDFLRSLKETVESADTDTGKSYREIGAYIFAALEHFDEGNYDQVMELLYPIRNQTAIVGGSNAQRDIFTLVLIHSAVYSNDHQHLAKELINERCEIHGSTKSKMMENYVNAILTN
jgi:tetratricopeptide (TPR) repeat protein